MFLIILFPDIWHIKQDLLKSTTICETRMHHSSTYAKKRYWHSTKYNTISLMGIAAGFNNMPVDTNILVEKTNSSYSVGDVLILYVGTGLHTLVAKQLPYDTNVSCSDRTRFTTKPLDKNIEWRLPVVCLLVEVCISSSYIAVVYQQRGDLIERAWLNTHHVIIWLKHMFYERNGLVSVVLNHAVFHVRGCGITW